MYILKVSITPTKEVRIFSLDERRLNNLLWCALSFGMDKLFWADGYLFCLEVYDKALYYEVEKDFFPINQICFIKFPKYMKFYEVEGRTKIPIVDVSNMQFYKKIVNKIQSQEK
jgi:hypothetical protein